MRRITQGLVLLLVLGLSVGLMSCSGDDDDEDISGIFQGTVTDNTGLSSNTAELVLQPLPGRVFCSWRGYGLDRPCRSWSVLAVCHRLPLGRRQTPPACAATK